jgi:predicted CXXCH cytochrome family protein
MTRIVSIVLAACLFAAPALAAEAPKGPVVIKSAKQGDVQFNHSSATHKAQKCATCHGEAGSGKIEGLDMKKGHAMCQDCHKKDEAKKAPTKCDGCHHKEKK